MSAVVSTTVLEMNLVMSQLSVDLAERRLRANHAWMIVLGFVAFVVVLAWGAYCVSTGGKFYWSFSIFQGFVIRCY